MLFFILQFYSIFHSVLARILAKKQVNYHYFHPSASFVLSIFKSKTCILHLFAFLVWLPAHYFLRPITRFLPLKCHFLMAILPFSAMFSTTLKRIIYTITMYFYPFRTAFSSILHCIQHQNALHFAPKRTAFSIKTHRIQHQNALRFAPNCSAFSSKQPKSWYKWQLF